MSDIPATIGCKDVHFFMQQALRAAKTSMGAYSEQLCEGSCLVDAINATANRVPHRTSYIQSRTHREFSEKSRERLWERAMLARWDIRSEQVGELDLEIGWYRLCAYQVPTYSKQAKDGWGPIDLLGCRVDGTPVVIELKGGDSAETPLRMVLEALAYAIAVRKNWPLIKSELSSIQQGGKTIKFQEKLDDIHLVAAAPECFWKNCLRGLSIEQLICTGQSFRKLLDALRDLHYPVSFVSISGDFRNPQELEAESINFPECCYS